MSINSASPSLPRSAGNPYFCKHTRLSCGFISTQLLSRVQLICGTNGSQFALDRLVAPIFPRTRTRNKGGKEKKNLSRELGSSELGDVVAFPPDSHCRELPLD